MYLKKHIYIYIYTFIYYIKDIQYNIFIYIYILNNIHNISNIDLEGAAGAWATLKSGRRVFPSYLGTITQEGF